MSDVLLGVRGGATAGRDGGASGAGSAMETGSAVAVERNGVEYQRDDEKRAMMGGMSVNCIPHRNYLVRDMKRNSQEDTAQSSSGSHAGEPCQKQALGLAIVARVYVCVGEE